MSNQVARTNDSSTVSKASMVSLGYFDDPFIGMFCEKVSRRAPIINRGYFIRVWAIHTLVTRFLNAFTGPKQIISLGAGFDSLYFRLKHLGLIVDNGTKFIEIDLPSVVMRKRSIIDKNGWLSGAHTSGEYSLHAVDLRDLNALIRTLETGCTVDCRVPTLVLAECVLNYLAPERMLYFTNGWHINSSNPILAWLADYFHEVAMVSYEQIEPSDGFGRFMLAHFEKLGSPVLSIHSYPTASDQQKRFISLGWTNTEVTTMNTIYYFVLPRNERDRIAKLEPFDEFEPWHAKCSHYTLVFARKGPGDWLRSAFVDNSLGAASVHGEREVGCVYAATILSCADHQVAPLRYGHSATQLPQSQNSRVLLVGGFGWTKGGGHMRCPQIVSLAINSQLDCYDVCSAAVLPGNLQLERMGHSCVWLHEAGCAIVCGGRTAPGTFAQPTLVALCISLDATTVTCNPVSVSDQWASKLRRYRHSCIVFKMQGKAWMMISGGLGEEYQVLSGCVLLSYIDENLTIKETVDLPKPLHSHTATVWNDDIVISGGLSAIDNDVSSDIFVYTSGDMGWRSLHTNGHFSPRYSHTSHVFEDKLVVVGGVNNLSCCVPAVTVVNLRTGLILDYSLPTTPTPIFLVSHSSILCTTSVDGHLKVYIIGGGGNCFSFGTLFNPTVMRLQLKF